MRMRFDYLAQASVSASLPPPVGGWDTRNALPDMPVQNAVILDNWFPDTDRVILRRGFASHATGMSGNVDSLLPYVGTGGAEKLFAGNGTSIFEVTSSGAVGAPDVTGLTNVQFQHCQMNTTGGNFLFIVNGDDTPRTYDGTTWANSTISGPTIANLIWCNVHQRRLWFGEKNSLTAYYLAADTINAAASSFHLGGIARLGGFIMGMATWTRDAGDGMDDAAIFVTSEGEAIVYRGTNPANAATWHLVGVYRIGKPLGRRFYEKFGADLVFLTQDGIVPASKILLTDRTQAENVAISQQVNQAFNDAVRDDSSNFGWQPVLYPRGRMIFANHPASTTEMRQFVFNTITQAPTRFTGMNARCWGMLNDELYFGGTDGVVYKADTGKIDGTANITGDALQAFSYFGTPGQFKRFSLVEPIFQSDGPPGAAIGIQLDFKTTGALSPGSTQTTSAGEWDDALWDVGTWGGADEIFRGFRGVTGLGRSAALRIRVDTQVVRPAWVATNYIYTPAGLI